MLDVISTNALRGPLLKTGATWGRDGSLIMDFSQECFYLATLEDASWLNKKIQSLSVVVYEDTLAVNRTSGLSVNRTGARIKPVAKTSSLASRRHSPEEALKFAVCGTHLQ
jgi:hypothetical protein